MDNHTVQDKGSKVAIFDLDGTIIKTKTGGKFPKNKDDWTFIEGVPEKLIFLKSRNYRIFIISNQAGITYGYVTHQDFKTKIHNITSALTKMNQGENVIDAFKYAYSPSSKFRKPNAGLVALAAKELDIRIKRSDSFVVGDASGKKEKPNFDYDIKLAERLGLKYYDIEDFVKTENINFV